MADQLRHAPWLAISILLHAIAALILINMPVAVRKQRKPVVMQAEPLSQDEPIVKQPEVEKLEKTEPIPDPEPELQTVDPIPTPRDNDALAESDDFDTDSNSAFDHDMFNDVIGIAGGAGPRGTRPSGRQRLRGTGSPVPEVIKTGLDWLENHQDADGKWSAAEFMRHDPATDLCTGPGNPVNDVGVTGLALLAFLGDGSTLRSGVYKGVVKKAVLWLKDQQNEQGLFGTESGRSFMYNHAIATLAFVEAYGLSRYRTLERYAQRAVDYVQQARNPYKVWRYYPHDGDNDTSITGWMVFALKSAKDFELKVDADALRYSTAWFEEVTDPSTGQCGYTKRGEGSSRELGMEQKFPAAKTEAMTATGLLCRIFLGQTPKTNPVLLTAGDTLAKRPPVWNETDGSIDLYYWYYGSYAMFQLGGRHWTAWKPHMLKALVKSQRRTKGRSDYGSWDPIGAWGRDGGRVYSTAIGVLCLEVYYRYTRLIR